MALSKRERFLAACRCEPVDRPPVWLMRQAGRYLPEYRTLRAEHDFLTCCKTPSLCAEISLQPLRTLDTDAVIIFQDILTPLEPLDVRLEIGDGGPKIGRPLRTWDDLHGLPKKDLGVEMAFVGEAHRAIRAEMGSDTALIGFCGAPYTLATYFVEGVTTKDHRQIKRLRWEDPLLFNSILQRIAELMVPYCVMQARAGADAIMLFDTWACDLIRQDFRDYAVPAVREIIRQVRAQVNVPIIYFPRGINGFWQEALATGADVLGFDHGTDLAVVRKALGAAPGIQGNLDPTALYAPESTITDAVRWIHRSLLGQPGHIFNLGHGILPDTPVSGAQAFVRAVQGLADLPPMMAEPTTATALTAPLED